MPSKIKELKKKANWVRNQILEMSISAASGHVTSSFSCTEFLVALYYGGVLRFDPKNPKWEGRDRFILSKGHACATLYAVLYEKGFLCRENLNGFAINVSNNIAIKIRIICQFIATSCIPNETKNMVTKKSLSPPTMPIISILYGILARITPAMKAPMAIEKPNEYANMENRKHNDMEHKNNSIGIPLYLRCGILDGRGNAYI